MRKLLTILCLSTAFICKGQIIQYLGSPTTQIYVRGQLRIDTIVYLPINDTTITPSQKGAIVFRNADNGLYIWIGTRWQRIAVGSTAWGQITGSISAQTDLISLLSTYQPLITAGYGIKNVSNIFTFDSAVVRKVDTMFRVNDSIISYTINGATRTILVRGTAAGGISSLTLGLPATLFSTPLVFNNASGVWSDTATFINQNPGTVFAGPTSGGGAVPTFRSLAVTDLPTGIPNAYLQNSFIAFNTGTSGTDINWASSPVALGATSTLNIPNAGLSARGLLTAGSFTLFNNKVDSTTISNDSVYDWHNGVANFRYLIITASSGLTSLNGLTAAVQTFANSTVGSDFSITSSGSTHTFNLPLASASVTGKLSSTDWATFNGKQNIVTGIGGGDTIIANNVERGGNLTKNTTINAATFTQFTTVDSTSGDQYFGIPSPVSDTNNVGYQELIQVVGGQNADGSKNVIRKMGFNIDNSENLNVAGEHWAMESNFNPFGSGKYRENHLEVYGKNGTAHTRLVSYTSIFSNDYSGLTSSQTDNRFSKWNFMDLQGNQCIQVDAAVGGSDILMYKNQLVDATSTTIGWEKFPGDTLSFDITNGSGNAATLELAGWGNINASGRLNAGGQTLLSFAGRSIASLGDIDPVGNLDNNYDIGAPTFRWRKSYFAQNYTSTLKVGSDLTVAADASAAVDINDVTRGFLPPRMTTTQKLAIASPAEGLMVYDLTLHQMSYFNGTAWVNF